MKRFYILCTAVVLLFAGCTATTGRYTVKEEKKQDERTKGDEKKSENKEGTKHKKKIDTTVPDSVYSAEEGDIPDNADDDPFNEKPSVVITPRTADETKADINAMTDADLQEAILVFLNTKYKYGGTSHEGIDCSAFTMNVFKDRFNILLKRSAREQYTMGVEVDKDNLKEGDLVFFNTRRRVRPGHVGIYIGNNRFVHASSSLGVTVSNLDETYYFKRYMGARRVTE